MSSGAPLVPGTEPNKRQRAETKGSSPIEKQAVDSLALSLSFLSMGERFGCATVSKTFNDAVHHPTAAGECVITESNWRDVVKNASLFIKSSSLVVDTERIASVLGAVPFEKVKRLG